VAQKVAGSVYGNTTLVEADTVVAQSVAAAQSAEVSTTVVELVQSAALVGSAVLVGGGSRTLMMNNPSDCLQNWAVADCCSILARDLASASDPEKQNVQSAY
jgi:hypothetical protein